ncbi:pyrroline-5-carboxylate reductase [Suttonella ornithocola]|uniref:Pyrroline-5-carboxylate reductase n=1 Tax=Suttonella ornithocola TaxID=279832 RepID=A0A380MUB2_9GAMM|nr:pyrroline-5-carboxylate reductase [Suttonella ornithocola]SUO95636.1 Pyrroline-5-carboxylate reductase [Suttonella ornithocola]
MFDEKIGFIGAGHMNSAIIKGILESDQPIITAKQILVSTKTQAGADTFKQEFGLPVSLDNADVIENAAYLFIGVKPQQMHELLIQLAEYDLSNTMLITVAAGIRIADYRKILGNDVTIVRAMPNMGAAYQVSLTGIYSDDDLSESDEALIDHIFSAIGSTAWLDDETQIDGITALSGSGIAYFFRLMQAMMHAGEQYGFEKDELFDIISLTALGAATLTLESEHQNDFSTFVKKIAVSGGTTEAAINILEKHKIDPILEETLHAAVMRSRALADKLTKDW